MMKRLSQALLSGSALAVAGAALAAETITYRYDALGRLIRVERSGTVNDAVNTNYSHDPADNRTGQATGTGLAPVPPPPDPPPEPPDDPPDDPPDPPPANQPPVANPDMADVQRCDTILVDAVANDSDPDGDLPLALAHLSEGTKGQATMISATTIRYEAGLQTGGDQLTYVVQDSRGAIASSTVNINILPGDCGL